MEQKAFVNGKIITNNNIHDGYTLFTLGDRIVGFSKEFVDLAAYQVIDLKGNYVCPSFIDLQIMGADSALYGGNPTADALWAMEQSMLKQGVAVFLPTVSTNSMLIMQRSIRIAAQYQKKSLGNFFGLHIEGPYINKKNKGAHPKEFIRIPTVNDIKEMMQENKSVVKMMTIAPEQFDSATMTFLEEQKIVLAMGHTAATYNDTLAFLEGKQKTITHLFNGMPAIQHRAPGPIPAIFEKKPYTSIVADGIHVDFRMVAFAKQNLGESLYLISDAATSCSTGIYQHTDAGDRFVTKSTHDDTPVLSGSKLTMLQAIKNCVQQAGISLAEAVNMATLYPSKALGIEGDNGSIAVGRIANFVVFDSDYHIQEIYFRGNLVSN